MRLPFFLVGPTAIGKTTLAVKIAAHCGAEIVSADAFQVYAGLDILTAKPTAEQRRSVPHHLVGTVPLDAEYNVARYLAEARNALADVARRGKRALVVGGSGLYVKALTHGLNPLPPPDPALRAELETWDLASLVSRLRELDAGASGLVDTMNKRRVIRAIETCAATGLPLQNARTSWRTPANAAADGLFLTRPRAELHERIRGRVAEMAAAGVLDEVRALAAVPFSATAARIIGLEQLRSCLHGDIDLDTALESIVVATRQYAKRQSTWFRGQSDFPSLDLSGNLTAQRVVEDVLRKMDAAEAQL